jgi:prepilin-type N-terminal cleavage/methylation domain-containing protein
MIRKSGFTIIEVAVGLAIAALLIAAFLTWQFRGARTPGLPNPTPQASPTAQPTNLPSIAQEWKFYQSSQFGVTFYFPPHWKAEEDIGGIDDVINYNGQDRRVFGEVRLITDEGSSVFRLRDEAATHQTVCGLDAPAPKTTDKFFLGRHQTKELTEHCSGGLFEFSIALPQKPEVASPMLTLTMRSAKESPLLRQVLLSLTGVEPTKGGIAPSL